MVVTPLLIIREQTSRILLDSCSQGRTRTEYRSRRIRQPYDSIEPTSVWDYWSWGLGYHPSLRPLDYYPTSPG
jgi:hypothetical protein